MASSTRLQNKGEHWAIYDTIRYDSVYLTCSKKLTGSQLSPPHGAIKKNVFVTLLYCYCSLNEIMEMEVRCSPIVMKAVRYKTGKDLLKR